MKFALPILFLGMACTSCITVEDTAPRFNHVMLYVSDADVTRAFYEDAFGMEFYKQVTEMVVLYEDAMSDTLSVNITLMRMPGHTFNVEFIQSPAASDTTLRSPHYQHIGIEVDDMAASMRRAESAGAVRAREMRDLQAGDIRAKTVFYYGPDGEMIELMEILEGEF